MRVVSVVLLLLGSTASLHAEGLTLKNEFREERLERAKVSTETVMGVMMTSDDILGEPALWSVVPRNAAVWSEGVCLRVTSKDGQYESSNEYSAPGEIDEPPATIQYPTEEQRLLRDANAVARATVGPCLARSETFVPIFWKSLDPEGAPSLKVYLNTGGQQAAVSTVGGFTQICPEVPEAARIKYTNECVVPLAELGDGEIAPLFFRISRNRTVERIEIAVVLAD